MPKDKQVHADNAEELLDEALEESFPASDPISPGVGAGEPIPNRKAKPPYHPKAETDVPDDKSNG